MVKNEVLAESRRIRNFGGYGSICLGLEINLAGSADFLDPNFQKSKFYPPPSTYIVIVILLLLYRLMMVGKILIFENLGVGTLPTPPNDSPDRDESGKKDPTS